MTEQESPVSGTTTYEYDSAGNLTETTDANGATTAREFDEMNRVTIATSTRSPDVEVVSWTYDDSTAGRFAIGRLATMTDPSGQTVYSYERRGLLRQETRTLAEETFLQTYGHDIDGNRSSIGYPSGQVVSYAFDHAGRPVTATGVKSSTTTNYVTAATYLPFGPVTSTTLGNGTVETRTYDARYQPSTIDLKLSSTTLAQHTYTTDAAGNITAIADNLNSGYNRTFAYDDLNRMTAANTGSALWGTGSYSYDRMGNMLSAALGPETRAFTQQGTTPKINTATGLASAMTYDPAGNELKSSAGDPGGGAAAAVYSPRNHLQYQFVREYDRCLEGPNSNACILPDLVQVWLSNVYDGRGVRIMSTDVRISENININDPEPEPRFYFYTPELTMLNIASRSTGRTADVIWFGSRPIADHDTTVRYTFTDHLGTPILQTSATAAVVWWAEYEPFGDVYQLRAGAANDDQPLRFPGQQVALATEAGEENYNIFRWYRSGWGRYTQTDLVGIAGGMNVYGYVESNPVNTYDPLGLMPVPWKDQDYRDCTSAEKAKCNASCKYGMDTCKVSRIFQAGVKNGKMYKGWVDGKLSCSCKEPDCWDKLKEWADPKKWFDPNPTPPLPLIPLVPPFTPTPAPAPVIPGFMPLLNPCYFGNYPGCDDGSWSA